MKCDCHISKKPKQMQILSLRSAALNSTLSMIKIKVAHCNLHETGWFLFDWPVSLKSQLDSCWQFLTLAGKSPMWQVHEERGINTGDGKGAWTRSISAARILSSWF